MNNNYQLSKEKETKTTVKINYKKITGYIVKPKGSFNYDGVTVNKVVLIKPSIVENVLKRKIKIRMNNLIKNVLNLIEEDDDDGSKYRIAMDEISRHRSIINNNYRIYLEQKYIENILRKIDILEMELKQKYLEVDDYELKGKAR